MSDFDVLKFWFGAICIGIVIVAIREFGKYFLGGGGPSTPYTPMCPNCHSHNTGKITAIKRVLEHSTFGWASPSSGNTFECYDCGYKW